MDDTLDQRLNRLVERILQGQCVPFLGAGISVGAPRGDRIYAVPAHEPDPTLNAKEIAKNLATKLLAHESTREPCDDAQRRFAALALNTAGQRRLSDQLLSESAVAQVTASGEVQSSSIQALTSVSSKELSNSEGLPLGELAELCCSVLGLVETVRTLQLDKWGMFAPTPAHHYLAILVREGFITEILETNYDEFVELAVAETFGGSREPKTNAAVVIHDLASYREHISMPRDDDTDDHLVRVVKLNGCAAAWTRAVEEATSERNVEARQESEERKERDDRLDEAARQIGLTEEQLQGWAEKQWARDLLRTRTRGRSLFFIGFAGADPLVRHHVLEVLREFGSKEEKHTGASDQRNWWEEANAPFIMEYNENLHFPQFQMLRAFCDAHAGPGRPADVYENVFLGIDSGGMRARLGRPRKGERKLPADDLLAVVAARAVQEHLCAKVLSDKSPLHAYLLGALRHPQTTLALLRAAISAPADPQEVSLWTTWLTLENPRASTQYSSAWAEACFSLRGMDAGRAGYRPFLNSPVKQPMLLVLLLLFSRATARGAATPRLPSAADLRDRIVKTTAASSTVRFGVRLADAQPQPGHRAVIATGRVDTTLRHWTDHADVLNWPGDVVLVALGRGKTVFRQQIRARLHRPEDGEVGTMVVRHVHVIGDLAALRGPGDGDSVIVPEAEHNLRRLAVDPGAWTTRPRNWRRYCRESM